MGMQTREEMEDINVAPKEPAPPLVEPTAKVIEAEPAVEVTPAVTEEPPVLVAPMEAEPVVAAPEKAQRGRKKAAVVEANPVPPAEAVEPAIESTPADEDGDWPDPPGSTGDLAPVVAAGPEAQIGDLF